MKKKINKNKLFYLVMFIIIGILLIVTGIFAYKDFFAKRKEEEPVVVKEELDNIELYGYTLDDLDTELYKEYFEELKTILKEKNVDYEEYAKTIVKLFVADFYSLDSKLTSSDFGGLEFIHPDLKDNFMLNAGDTIYNHVKTNLDGKREQELPSVLSVTIDSIEEDEYTYNDEDYESYVVSATWKYKKDLGYETSGDFIVIKDDNKLYIVEK